MQIRIYGYGADDAVPHHASADSDAAGENRDAEDVEFMADSLDRAGDGEYRGSEKIENEDEQRFHLCLLEQLPDGFKTIRLRPVVISAPGGQDDCEHLFGEVHEHGLPAPAGVEQ